VLFSSRTRHGEGVALDELGLAPFEIFIAELAKLK
jgi:hypothetical protein